MEVRVYVIELARRGFVLRWKDTETGRWRQRRTGAAKRPAAEREAGKLRAELEEGRYVPPDRCSWDEFRERYEEEKLSSLAMRTAQTAATALNHVERLMRPQWMREINAQWVSQFQARLREGGLSEASIATNLRHVRAALSWGQDVGYVSAVPKFRMPRRARRVSRMRGRPLTNAEFRRMLDAVAVVRPYDAVQWRFYLEGVWWSGFRLEESLQLGWDDDADLCVQLDGRRSRVRIWAEGEKGYRDRLLPLVPEFVVFLERVPEAERRGRVFKLERLDGSGLISSKRVCRIVSAIGGAAGIVVNEQLGKYASLHDLRRSFGTRWAAREAPARVMQLMRHEEIETTMQHYVAEQAHELGEELWRKYPPDGIDLGAADLAGRKCCDQSCDVARDGSDEANGRLVANAV